MSQNLKERINVKYSISKNGLVEYKECSLANIPEKDRENIISLGIFPLSNKNEKETENISDISKYIKDMNMLQIITYPNQFSTINVGQIQKNGCPNLHQIIRTVPEGFDGISSLNVNGIKTVSSSTGSSKEELSSFASVLPDKQNAIEVIEVPVKSATTKKTATKKNVVTHEDISKQLKFMEGKLEEIGGRVGSDRVPTIKQLEDMLGKFTGELAEEELQVITNAVNNINVNTVDVSALNGVVEKTITDKLYEIAEEKNADFDNKLNEFALNITKLKNETEKLSYIKENMPALLASDSKMRTELALIEASMGSTQREVSSISEKMGEYFQILTQGSNLSENAKKDISNIFNVYANDLNAEIQSGNSKLLNDVNALIPSAEKVQGIVHAELESLVSNENISNIMSVKIADQIIKTMGGLENMKGNEVNVQNFVANLSQNDEFKSFVTKIANGSDLARSADINDIKELMSKNYQEELGKINSIVQNIEYIPTRNDIQDIVRDELSAQSSYMLRRLGVSSDVSDPSLVGIVNGVSDKLDDVLAECKNKGMTKDDMKSFFMSEDGRNVLSSAVGLSAIENQLIENRKKDAENAEKLDAVINQYQALQQAMKTIALGGVNIYNGAYGLATGVMSGGAGISAIPVGYNAYISQPFMYPQGISGDLNMYINNAVKAQITNILSVMGLPNPVNPDPRNTKDEVIEKLNKDVEANKKEIAEMRKELKEIIDKLSQMQGNIKTKEDDEKKPTPEPQPQPKPVPTPKPTPTPKPVEETIIPPKPKKKTFVEKSVDMMDMLSEPKMTRSQKFKKWIKRHPLALTACGIGAGALLGAGYGVIAAGGVGALIANSMYFIPTLKTLGIGAAIGLGAGAVGEVVGRVAGLGKKDRLYKKFLKEKCDAYKQTLELMERAIENEKASIANSLENMQSGKKLKSLKRCKKANMAKAKKLATLRTKQRVLKSDYKSQVEKFLEAKQELNNYEEQKGKTMAMAGNLQELRNARAKAQVDMMNAEDEEEKEIIQEQLETEEQIIDASAGKKISSLSDNFKTGDAEAYEILNDVKNKSQAMNRILDDIKERNGKTKETPVEVEYYDEKEVADYVDKLRKSGNEADKNKAKDFLAQVEEKNKKLKELYGDKIDAARNKLVQQNKQTSITPTDKEIKDDENEHTRV